MTTTDNLRDDIAYVRAAAERREAGRSRRFTCCGPSSGCAALRWPTLPQTPGRSGCSGWWRVRPGFVVSLWLGYRAGRHAGQGSRRVGVRWGLHWLAFMAAGALGAALVAAGHLPWTAFGSLVVLLLALSYFYAGLYMDRRMLAIGVVLGACFLVTLFIPGYQWTLAGVLMAGALVWQAILGARERDAAH